jgi:hypothetical protein
MRIINRFIRELYQNYLLFILYSTQYLLNIYFIIFIYIYLFRYFDHKRFFIHIFVTYIMLCHFQNVVPASETAM